MKIRAPHIVPLSQQAIAVLKELTALTGGSRLLFHGAYNKERPMSDNTVNAALRRLGYSREEMTGHGFRSMASALLNQRRWNAEQSSGNWRTANATACELLTTMRSICRSAAR